MFKLLTNERDAARIQRIGGAMSVVRSDRAEETSALLLQAERRGSPVMIPGAFEVRARAPRTLVIHGGVPRATDQPQAAGVADRERLEHEREGGGAPSERIGGRAVTVRGRLWRSILHPTQVLDIWRRLVPQTTTN
jgi:hypothetical protein